MIGLLRGRPIQVDEESVVLDVAGVGYAIEVPVSTRARIAGGGEEEIELHVHTHVRDDGITLYGFWEKDEKRLFERLIGVSGVGPRLAQAVLSGLSADEVVEAIGTGDLARLTSVSGVGKKTAQRIVLELKDTVGDLAIEPLGELPSPDVVEALVGLGYGRADAERAASEARREADGDDLSELVRLALRKLARV